MHRRLALVALAFAALAAIIWVDSQNITVHVTGWMVIVVVAVAGAVLFNSRYQRAKTHGKIRALLRANPTKVYNADALADALGINPIAARELIKSLPDDPSLGWSKVEEPGSATTIMYEAPRMEHFA